ncbi:MAG: AraC family transcriptional regulator [Planctomycetota bacterium]|jgi:AraC-like DNA-binding protein|nr:AraC family transcriptional regulator [Planctomycetota bacterium]
MAREMDHAPLWRVRSFELNQRVLPRQHYWWDNRDRNPADHAVFQLTLDGAMIFEDNGVELMVPGDHAVIYLYGEQSSYGLPDPGTAPRHYEARYGVFEGAGVAEHFRALIAAGARIIRCEPGGTLRKRFDAAIAMSEDSDDPLVVASSVQAFMLALYDQARRTRAQALSPADQAVDRILAMPHHAWSLKALATDHGCSREHLLRTFHARTGEPPATWLRRHRLERAIALLRDSDLSVAEVARQSGFSSTHTLARLIREVYECSPTDFRVGG